jgi:hypothetical protein
MLLPRHILREDGFNLLFPLNHEVGRPGAAGRPFEAAMKELPNALDGGSGQTM